MVSYIGYHLRTDEHRTTSVTVFLCLCVDMILLPTLIGLNLVEYQNLGLLSNVFKGKHTDLGAQWYPDIGYQITVTMIIFAFQPLIDFLIEFLVLKIVRFCKKRKLRG